MKTEKLLLIQPHSDDILFSCSHFLFLPQYEVQVLTVENDPKRIAEDEKLFEFLNIPFHHLDINFIDDSYYGYYKKSGFAEMSDRQSEQFLYEYYENGVLDNLGNSLINFIEDFLQKFPDYKIVSPLGIGHPFHHWVFSFLSCYGHTEFCYREFPHSYKRKAKKHLESRLLKFELFSSVDVSEFDEVKWKLASKFYRSQSGLLFYEQGYIKKRLNEEIYSPIFQPVEDDLPF